MSDDEVYDVEYQNYVQYEDAKRNLNQVPTPFITVEDRTTGDKAMLNKMNIVSIKFREVPDK